MEVADFYELAGVEEGHLGGDTSKDNVRQGKRVERVCEADLQFWVTTS